MGVRLFIKAVLEDIRKENWDAKKPLFTRKFAIESSEIAQKLIDDLYRTEPTHTTLENAGLTFGQETVLDYLNHGESHLAVEHLLYMIHSADILYPRDRMLQLHAFVKEAGIKNHYDRESIAAMAPDSLKWIYNKP